MQFLGSSGYLQKTCKRRLRNSILQKEKEKKLIFSTFKNKIHAKKKQIIKVFLFINFTLEEDCTSIRLKHHGTPTNARRFVLCARDCYSSKIALTCMDRKCPGRVSMISTLLCLHFIMKDKRNFFGRRMRSELRSCFRLPSIF